MTRSLDSSRQFALVRAAYPSSFLRSDFCQAGNKLVEQLCLLKVNFFDVSLAEIAIHNRSRNLNLKSQNYCLTFEF